MVFNSVFSCIELIQKRHVILDIYRILITSKCIRNSFHLLLDRKVKKGCFALLTNYMKLLKDILKSTLKKRMKWHDTTFD